MGFIMKRSKGPVSAGEEVALGAQSAARMLKNGSYHYEGERESSLGPRAAKYLAELRAGIRSFPSKTEWPEDDFEGWKVPDRSIGEKCQLVGDDLS